MGTLYNSRLSLQFFFVLRGISMYEGRVESRFQ